MKWAAVKKRILRVSKSFRMVTKNSRTRKPYVAAKPNRFSTNSLLILEARMLFSDCRLFGLDEPRASMRLSVCSCASVSARASRWRGRGERGPPSQRLGCGPRGRSRSCDSAARQKRWQNLACAAVRFSSSRAKGPGRSHSLQGVRLSTRCQEANAPQDPERDEAKVKSPLHLSAHTCLPGRWASVGRLDEGLAFRFVTFW